MTNPRQAYYDKMGPIVVKNLRSRHFDAYYCPDRASALSKALALIPQGASVGWGGAASAHQIGLMEAVHAGDYLALDRELCQTNEEREEMMRRCSFCDVFLTGANAISVDGQMVNIDGLGNRVSAMIYGPKSVLVIAGMNKVESSLEAAMNRARTVAAPINAQRFGGATPCTVTGVCGDCKSDDCICNHIVITRGSRIPGRIKFILVGEDLGF